MGDRSRPQAPAHGDTPTLLETRASTPARLLEGPAPEGETLERILRAALRVPDHGGLTPWRLLRIRGAARLRLGEFLGERLARREPDSSAAALDKERQRFTRAPLVIVVVGRIHPHPRIPEQEQLLSGACVCFALLLAAHAHGFAGQWLTGWAAYDPDVATHLGLAEHERVLGFIHLGSARERAPERPRPALASLLDDWDG